MQGKIRAFPLFTAGDRESTPPGDGHDLSLWPGEGGEDKMHSRERPRGARRGNYRCNRGGHGNHHEGSFRGLPKDTSSSRNQISKNVDSQTHHLRC
jgi:hypothetical protein